MITGLVIAGSAVSGAIVCTPAPEMLKVITSRSGLVLAQRIAARNEPAPLSLMFTTSVLQALTRVTHAENSDVLLFVSVAVAVKNVPAGVGKLAVKFAVPPALVVTFVAPRKVCPWPKPFVPHATFAKNSMR